MGRHRGDESPLGAAAATVAWLAPDRRLHLMHAGDARALLLDGDRVTRLTQEHGGGGHTIYNHCGIGRVQIARSVVPLEEGTTLVLVTDGVTKVMRDEQIAAAAAAGRDPDRAAKEIVTRARGRRSNDDITCVVVDIEDLHALP